MPDAETAAPWRLSDPVRKAGRVGPAREAALKRLGIETIADLLRHVPTRYEAERAYQPIASLEAGELASIRARVTEARWEPGRGGRAKGRFEATVTDEHDVLRVCWFNAPHMVGRIHPDEIVELRGKLRRYRGRLQLANPHWRRVDDPADAAGPATDRIRPVYPATEGLDSDRIAGLISGILPTVLPRVSDPVPEWVREKRGFPELAEAYRGVHSPDTMEQAELGRRRLAYNEWLLWQLGMAIKRRHREAALAAPALRWSERIDRHIRGRFPFPLTDAQDRVVREIAADLGRERPMHRLLQGDVGSGKTVVALYALLMSVADRRQGALMSPTELLAEQHYAAIARMLGDTDVRLALFTASQPAPGSRERNAQRQRIASGEIDLVIGTHALIGGDTRFHDLAVAVVDEQHRFGVEQRAALREQEGRAPHTLIMTATPIPRTLGLTLFGDLDLSTIDRLPPGRRSVVTRAVGTEKADRVYGHLRRRLEAGEQAYVVVPAVAASDDEEGNGIKSVDAHARRLRAGPCQGFRIATVHGQMRAAERERVMERFRRGWDDVLVATTVIEVGVDVPNASVMIVENAERFGLAQLHQLRGRIGRRSGGPRPLCVLIGDPPTEEGRRRLAAIAETADGFRVAERDFEIRGMGEFVGTRQSGATPFRVARIPGDLDLLDPARQDAGAIVDADPRLERPENDALRRLLKREYGHRFGLIDVG